MKSYLQVFILILFFITFGNASTTITIDKVVKEGPNPSIGCSNCKIDYYVRATDSVTTGIFTDPPVILAPLSGTVYVEKVIPPSSVILHFIVEFPSGQVYNTIYFTYRNNTNGFPDQVICNSMPDNLTIGFIDTMTNYYGNTYQTVILLNENLVNMTYTDGGSPSYTTVVDNPLYSVTFAGFEFSNMIVYAMYLEVTYATSITTNKTLQDDITVEVGIDFGVKKYTIVVKLPSPYPFIPQNDSMTTIKTYPDTSYTTILRPGFNAQTMILFSNMKSPFFIPVAQYAEPLKLVLGNAQNATFVSSFDGFSSSATFYQVADRLYQYYRIQPNFTSPSAPMRYANSYLYAGGGVKLFVEVTTTSLLFFRQSAINNVNYPYYPFGYSLTNNTINYQFTMQLYRVSSMYNINIQLYSYSSTTVDLSSVPVPETNPPVLYDFKCYQILGMVYYQFNVTDESGLDVFKFSRLGVSSGEFAFIWLVDGDTKSGIYMYSFSISFITNLYPSIYNGITLTDIYGNSRSYTGYELNDYLDTIPLLNYIPVISQGLMGFTLFQFIPNNVDTTNGPVNVSVLFNMSIVDVNYRPAIVSLPESNLLKQNTIDTYSYAEWDYTDKVYRADITIPQRMANMSVNYIVNYMWGRSQFITMFGDSAHLKVYSSYTDMMPPVAEYLDVFPGPNVNITSGSTTIGYTITISDEPNGLKGGYINITSNIDGKPYTFNFNSTYLVSGNQYRGTYSFPITTGSTCVNQIFQIQELRLWDNSGMESVYAPQQLIMNPLYKTLSKSINLNCAITSFDLTQPTIQSFKVTPSSIDVGSLNRDVVFTLSVFDSESGLSPRHDPMVYLTQYSSLNTIELKHDMKTVYNQSYVSYRYSTTVPVLFGCGNITLSVYGITDNNLNLNGYSTVQLKNSSFDYILQTTCTFSQPIISESNSLYQHGGMLTITGIGFGQNLGDISLYIDYQDGNGLVLQPANQVIMVAYKFAIIQVKSSITSSFINIQFKRTTKLSNIFRINVTNYYKSILPKPPPITTICPGTPLCNGNGNCTTNGCICNDPWSGPDCSSKPIIIPTPTTNTTDPVIVIDTGNGTSSTTSSSSTTGGGQSNRGIDLKTIISIYSIRELSISGSTVQEYFPTVWLFTNQSSGLMEGEFKYLYSTILNNTSTMFNVTIQWFINQSTIQFAGQQINIQPYTIKESLYISPYPFQSSLNTLQIIFNTEISSKSSQCSGKQVSNSDHNDIQWIKLNIDDKSLYANFIKRGEIDGRSIAIKNSLLDSEFQTGVTQSFVGINVPNYQSSVFLDPDFSHLLNVGGDNNGDGCSPSNQDNKKTPIGMIAGIVIGCVAAVAIAIAFTMYYTRKTRLRRQSIQLQKKIGNAKL